MTIGNAMAILGGFALNRAGLITLGTTYLIVHYVNLLGGDLSSTDDAVTPASKVTMNRELSKETL